MISKTIYLRSGKWRCYGGAERGELELVDPARTTNKKRVPVPQAAAGLPEGLLEEMARRPDVRLWTDEHGIAWRVSAIGPGTRYPLDLGRRHLLFDSEQAWAGIVAFDLDLNLEVGDLTELELRGYRDQISDLGGRRQGFRPPNSDPDQRRPSARHH